MDDFTGCRAVVTGGASGIGRGLAISLLEEGAAHVVLVDVEPAALDATVAELQGLGLGEVSGQVCDVTDPDAVDALAGRVREQLGGVDVVCLNAGVFAGGHAWETTLDDWDWVMGVNLWGVIHGIRSFVPAMVDAGTPAHVLITASVAGVVAAPASAVYVTSKFAAMGLGESLQHDLVLVGAHHVATSVICPGMVATNIDHGDRNRPDHLVDATDTAASNLAAGAITETLRSDAALDPVDGARHAIAQAKAGRFYVTTHAGDMWDRLVGNHNEDRLAGRPPRFQMYE